MADPVKIAARPGDYALLRAYGHTPQKAAEIVLDATRGDAFAAGWIAVIRRELERERQS